MRNLSFKTLIFMTLKYSTISAVWISTVLPLPEDLELLIDSMYDDGYSPEYLVKYDDITGDDLAQSDLLLGWEKAVDKRPVKRPVLGIIDPDRDGARNLPLWMNFSKAVFVPNEIDYKIRARHRFHPHNGRIESSLQRQMEGYHPDDRNAIYQMLAGKGNGTGKITRKVKKNSSTTENLDFLLPIPEYGTSTKKPLLSFKNVKPSEKTNKQNFVPKPFINSYLIQQNPEVALSTPGPAVVVASMPQTTDLPNVNNGQSLFGWIDMFKKKIKAEKTENITSSASFNCNTLENLYLKLIKMREQNVNLKERKSEEDKLLTQVDESSDCAGHIKRMRAMKPLISHVKLSHPGHRSSYISHVGPLTLNQHNQRGHT